MYIDQSLSIIVPAKNEAPNIVNTLKKINSVSHLWREVEIILIDDGSSDETSELGIKYLEETNLKNTIIKNTHSKNLGGVFKQGLQLCKNDYVMVIQGQDDTNVENLKNIFFALSPKIDLVIPFQFNYTDRPFVRWSVSRIFVLILNMITGFRLEYYNHSVLMKRSLVEKLDIKTSSYAYQAEIIIKLLRSQKSYRQVPVRDQFSHKEKTSAFKPKNLIGVLYFFFQVFIIRN